MKQNSVRLTAPFVALLLAAACAVAPNLHAQLMPGPDPITGTVNAAQTLASGTGTVSATGTLSVSGGAVAVTITGGSTLNNFGTIEQTGTGRAIRLTANNVSATVNNGSMSNSTALVRGVGDDAFQVNQANASIVLNNYGTFDSTGGQAIDWGAILTGSNTLNNFSSGFLTATGSDAVRPGVNGMIMNAGTIRATPVQSAGNASGSDGIDAQTNTGIQIMNSGTIQGRAGITGGVTVPGTFAINVTNNSGGVIAGVNGSGINIDGVATSVVATVINNAGATIRGSWDGVSANGDGDGIDVDGVLNLTNRGFIRALGANGVGSDGFPNGADGIAAGGGTIVNEAGAEITAGNTVGNARFSQGILIDDSSRGNSIAATTVTNRGLISSAQGPAVVFISTFANTITNDVGGTISGSENLDGTAGAAIQTGNGGDMVINRGTITGSNGAAIDLQGGNNTLTIEGGAAAINGSVNGGVGGTNALIFSPGAGNTFSYAGSFSNFATAQVNAGTTSLSGNSTYSGTTTIANGGTLIARNTVGPANSATGMGAVTVQNGGTLAGTGRIGGPVTVAAGGRVAPSNYGALAPATLTLGSDLNVTGNSRFAFTLGSTAMNTDRLVIGGNLNFTGPGQVLVDISITGAMVGMRYQLVDFASAPGLSVSNLALGNVPPGFNGTFDLNGTNIGLTVTAIPEPSALLLFGGAGTLLLASSLWRARRRGVRA